LKRAQGVFVVDHAIAAVLSLPLVVVVSSFMLCFFNSFFALPGIHHPWIHARDT